MEKKLKLIGEMDNSDGTLESANRVYEGRGQLLPYLQPVVEVIYQKP